MKRAAFILAALALGGQHGPDAPCWEVCYPDDVEMERKEEVPTYTCAGACKSGETDPCAEGKEAKDCGEYCRKACCRCHQVHCP